MYPSEERRRTRTENRATPDRRMLVHRSLRHLTIYEPCRVVAEVPRQQAVLTLRIVEAPGVAVSDRVAVDLVPLCEYAGREPSRHSCRSRRPDLRQFCRSPTGRSPGARGAAHSRTRSRRAERCVPRVAHRTGSRRSCANTPGSTICSRHEPSIASFALSCTNVDSYAAPSASLSPASPKTLPVPRTAASIRRSTHYSYTPTITFSTRPTASVSSLHTTPPGRQRAPAQPASTAEQAASVTP